MASQELRKGGPARTRFAPSPTGYLHLGSLRTALFNFLVAKATGGKFLLRIEDTDRNRTLKGAEEKLFQDLEWAGIEWDEGPKVGGPFGPYKQSERTAFYREHAQKLLESGHAYRCFCSPERLYELAAHRSRQGLPPDYDRTCAHLHGEQSDEKAAKGDAHVVRLKVPDKYPIFHDLVYGLVRQRSDLTTKPRGLDAFGAIGSFDDPILLKSDGFPTYHLANVVDDHLMEITHVIRGSEWMSSTPKHLAMYQAFGWEPPAFAHVGLLLDKDRQKLSKRTASTDISAYREMGIFPETLTNFVALLGWSHNAGKDIMSMKDLIHNASMKYTRGDSIVGFEKLNFLQKRHAARYASQSEAPDHPLHDLTELAVKPIVKLLDRRLENADNQIPIYSAIPKGQLREEYIHAILMADAQNYQTPSDFITRSHYFFSAPTAVELAEKVPNLKLRNVPPGVPFVPDLDTITLFRSIYQHPDEEWTVEHTRGKIAWIIKQGTTMSLVALNEDQGETGTSGGEGAEKLISQAWGKLVHGYLRWAIAGSVPGPDGAQTMQILGREETVERLELAEKVMRESQAEREKKAAEEGGSSHREWL
ncbi:hypothetical protein LZ554_004570 [Drepanopeziza brunnea f. sp. 'monogermtubi']|nr:hypothetical protein LZ554_004570 [Drepanopeziza brunnea f. sp. 'monogermtubi']